MRKTVHKWFWVWNFDKEETWLNHMSAMGLNLIAVSWCRYEFEEGQPGEYQYRLELLENMPQTVESSQYIRFLEDTGVKYIGNVLRWAYFRKKTDEKGFNLFSDLDSRAKHLKRIMAMVGIVGLAQIPCGISNISIGIVEQQQGNLIIGICNIAMLLLLGYGFYRLGRKRKRLLAERTLRE